MNRFDSPPRLLFVHEWWLELRDDLKLAGALFNCFPARDPPMPSEVERTMFDRAEIELLAALANGVLPPATANRGFRPSCYPHRRRVWWLAGRPDRARYSARKTTADLFTPSSRAMTAIDLVRLGHNSTRRWIRSAGHARIPLDMPSSHNHCRTVDRKSDCCGRLDPTGLEIVYDAAGQAH